MPEERDPLVSILTPSFNQARWLEDNLRSIASQTYPRIEHVVMDGGSTDGSAELLERAGENVRWASEKDRGQSDALNKAFRASSGEIIGWLNSDDAYFSRDAVRTVVDYFVAHPEVDVVYGHTAYVNANGLILLMIWAPPFFRWWLRMEDIIPQPAAFVRRSALGDTLVDESLHFAMDYDLWLRLLRDGKRFARIDKVLAVERGQAERKTLSIADIRKRDVERLAKEYGIGTEDDNQLVKRILGVKSRFFGLRLVRAIHGDLAFAAQPVSTADVVRRQVAARRSRMDLGD